MTRLESPSVPGEGLTRAAEALAAGSDELHLHDAALHLAQAMGARTVAIVSATDRDRMADRGRQRDDRSQEDRAALLGGASFAKRWRRAMSSWPSASGRAAEVAGDPEIWAMFPVVINRRAAGVVVASFAQPSCELDGERLLCGRAAAALVAVALPSVEAAPGSSERTRKVALSDVRRERRLRAIERYRAFIDSASDGIVVLDETGLVLYMNRAAEQVTGYARKGMEGKNLSHIVSEEHQETLRQMVARAVKSRPVDNFDLELVTTSADRITVSRRLHRPAVRAGRRDLRVP